MASCAALLRGIPAVPAECTLEASPDRQDRAQYVPTTQSGEWADEAAHPDTIDSLVSFLRTLDPTAMNYWPQVYERIGLARVGA